jgi:hypothetical protein
MVEMGVIVNPIGAQVNATQTQVHNQALMSIQYINASPAALFVGNDFSALLPNQYTSSIITDLQGPVWNPANINQPSEFVGSDLFSLLANQNMNASITFLQAPDWLPAVAFAPQTAEFAGSDVYSLLANQNKNISVTSLQSPALVPALVNQPALFAFYPEGLVYPNISWTQILTDVQAPTWIASTTIPQPSQFVGSDIYALLANRFTSSIVTFLQSPAWIPSVSTPQPALFVGSDINALRPNTTWTQFITALQPPAWIPSTSIPQPALFAGSDINALRPNTNWTVPNTYLQSPEWLQLPIQPIQQTTTIIASLLANQYALQSQLQNVATANFVANEYVNWLWHVFVQPFNRFIINVTENLGLVTETLLKHKSSFLSEGISVTDSTLKRCAKFLSEALGGVVEIVTKHKRVSINVSDSDCPACPPSGGGGFGRFIRDIGGTRRLGIGRRTNQ